MTTPAVHPTEQQWLRRARAGDANAFAAIVHAYQKPVYNLCYRTLGDAIEAEDAAQETFLRAYTNLHRYDPDRRFLTWILSIASNHCIDRLRRRRHTWLSLDDDSGDEPPLSDRLPADGASLPWGGLAASETNSPHHQAERRETSEHIQLLLNRLAPDYRTPLILLYWYELSYDEIAATLNLSVPAVKSRLHRARHQMAELLAGEAAAARPPARGDAEPAPAAALGFAASF